MTTHELVLRSIFPGYLHAVYSSARILSSGTLGLAPGFVEIFHKEGRGVGCQVSRNARECIHNLFASVTVVFFPFAGNELLDLTLRRLLARGSFCCEVYVFFFSSFMGRKGKKYVQQKLSFTLALVITYHHHHSDHSAFFYKHSETWPTSSSIKDYSSRLYFFSELSSTTRFND